MKPIDKPIDFSKPVRTKMDKLPVTIYTTNGLRPKYPVVGTFTEPSNPENYALEWMADGRFYEGAAHKYDLEQAPEPVKMLYREFWVNLYPETPGNYTFLSEKDAVAHRGIDALATVKVIIDVPAGTGLTEKPC